MRVKHNEWSHRNGDPSDDSMRVVPRIMQDKCLFAPEYKISIPGLFVYGSGIMEKEWKYEK